MKSPLGPSLLLPSFVLAMALLVPGIGQAWPTSPTVNVPLSTAALDQTEPYLVSDGAGGAIVAWQDARTTGNGLDIYVRRVDGTGTPLWTADGVPLCTLIGDQRDPVVCSDGAGGAFVAWTDGRIATGTEIYAQHILAAGVVDPVWPINGAPVCTATADQLIGGIHADGAGGAYVVWTDYRNNVDLRPDVYAQRLDPSGAPMWTVDGMIVVRAPVSQIIRDHLHRNLGLDALGGLLVCWQDQLGGQWNIAAQRLDRVTGVQLWPAFGASVCAATGDQVVPTMVPDGAGGAIIAWQDGRAGQAIYAQRMNPGGAPLWAPNGIGVCLGPWPQIAPRIVADAAGGAIIAWQDNRASALFDLYAQRVSAFGALLWGGTGVPLCTAAGDQLLTGITPDGSGGAIATWSDARTAPGLDVYAQRISPGGLVYWAPDGVAISTASGDQAAPRLVGDGAGGAVVAWQDARDSGTSGWDVYVQGVGASGALGGHGSANPPGAPLAGAGFSTRLREDFVYPPAHAPASESAIAIGLPAPVEPGFVVLVDDPSGSGADSSKWSDIVMFTPVNPMSGPLATLISDPIEHPFTDADLAVYGLSIDAVRNGNTVFLPEVPLGTLYSATAAGGGPNATYTIYSDVDTLPPGTPLSGPGFHVSIAEPPEGPIPEPPVTIALPALVQPGYVVLVEDPARAAEDSTNWSDVAMFSMAPTGAPQLTLVSDADSTPAAPSHRGIDSQDLAPLGVTVMDVLEGNTIYMREAVPSIHVARHPTTGVSGIYDIYSDASDAAVPGGAGGLALAIRALAPNPARGATRVDFELPRAARVRLEVFGLAGQRVRTLVDGPLGAGPHSSAWDGRGDDGHRVAPGLYLVRLAAERAEVTSKLVLMR